MDIDMRVGAYAEISLRKQQLLVLAYYHNGALLSGIFDPAPRVLPSTAECELLGRAVCDALARYEERWLDFNEVYAQGPGKLAAAFGLKSTRGLYPGMKVVSISLITDRLQFRPTRARRGGYFEDFPDHWTDKEDVVIPYSSSDAEIGAAARLALSRSSA